MQINDLKSPLGVLAFEIFDFWRHVVEILGLFFKRLKYLFLCRLTHSGGGTYLPILFGQVCSIGQWNIIGNIRFTIDSIGGSEPVLIPVYFVDLSGRSIVRVGITSIAIFGGLFWLSVVSEKVGTFEFRIGKIIGSRGFGYPIDIGLPMLFALEL